MDFTRAKFKIEDAASKLTKRHTKDSYIGLIKVNYIFAWIVLKAYKRANYCKSTNFDRYKIWLIDHFLSDNRGFSLYNPI